MEQKYLIRNLIIAAFGICICAYNFIVVAQTETPSPTPAIETVQSPQNPQATLSESLKALKDAITLNSGSTTTRNLYPSNQYEAVSFNQCLIAWKHTATSTNINTIGDFSTQYITVDYNYVDLATLKESSVKEYRDDEGAYSAIYSEEDDKKLIKVNRGKRSAYASAWEEANFNDSFEKLKVSYVSIYFGKEGKNNKKISEDFARHFRNAINLCQDKESEPLAETKIELPPHSLLIDNSLANLSLDDVFKVIKAKLADHSSIKGYGDKFEYISLFVSHKDCKLELMQGTGYVGGNATDLYLYEIPLAELRFPKAEPSDRRSMIITTSYDKLSIIKKSLHLQTYAVIGQENVNKLEMALNNENVTGLVSKHLVHAIKLCRNKQ